MSLLVHIKQKLSHCRNCFKILSKNRRYRYPLTHIYMIEYFSKRYRRFNKNGGFKLVYGTKPLLLTTKPLLLATKPLLLATKPLLLATKPLLLATKPLLLATKPLLLASKPLLLATKPLLLATKRRH